MCDRLKTSLLSLVLLAAVCVSVTIGKDVVVAPESNVTLNCSLLNHVWKKDNNTIKADDKGYSLENGTLVIKKVDQAHMGVYVCTTEDGENTETTVVNVTPYVKHFEKTKNMIQDDPLQLECKGYGYPTPVVEWYRGTDLLAADGDRIALRDTTKQADSGVMTNGTIRVQKMTFDDAGNYTCIATNIYGSSNATIKVQVKDKLAALWPFLGICAEVAILCAIIFIYERRRAKKMQEEDENQAPVEEAERLNANNDKGNDEVRQRKQ